MKTISQRPPLVKTGIEGLDHILGGGLPPDRLYMVHGNPGVGKTTLALQFLLEGLNKGEKCLYVTLSESRAELTVIAESHGWDVENLSVIELSAIVSKLSQEEQNTLFHPSEIELSRTIDFLTQQVEAEKPTRVVFDSLSELRLMAEGPLRYRRQLLALKQFFIGRNVTVLLLDDLEGSEYLFHVHTIAHGVICLEKLQSDFGAHRRRLEISKLRGVKFRDGLHDYIIARGGIKVFPRLNASEHEKVAYQPPLSAGIREFDTLLGGGLDRGTSTLFLGPAGTGKSTLAMVHAVAAARAGERAVIFCFDENENTLRSRLRGIDLEIDTLIDANMIEIREVDPAELTPGEFSYFVKESAMRGGARVIVIDSLNGYLNSMPDEKFLSLHLHELLAYLSRAGVVTIMTLAQHGVIGMMGTPVDITYLADTVILLRYFENAGYVRKAISVVKKRSGLHEDSIREFKIDRSGVRVGPPLEDFRGVLTGTPEYFGKQASMLKSR
ncbi:MAG TPA: gas vesicle protein GvpD [Opitutaceae bacterium]|nr:gas vesicle protein GvpD [Opitutaceae bacterium]